jgi:hypothetical protein
MRGRGNGLSRDEQLAHVVGQLEALTWDIRHAKASGNLADLAELEVKRDHLLDHMLRLQPAGTVDG